jgi:hypothetical protein
LRRLAIGRFLVGSYCRPLRQCLARVATRCLVAAKRAFQSSLTNLADICDTRVRFADPL